MFEKRLPVLLISLAAADALAAATGKAPPEWGGRVNWHAWARTTSIPALHSAACLTDGDTDTAAQFTIGGEAGADLKIAFPKPVEVTGLRFAQKRPAASHVQLWADPDGSGAYTNLVADRKDEKPVVDEWIDIPVGMTQRLPEAGRAGNLRQDGRRAAPGAARRRRRRHPRREAPPAARRQTPHGHPRLHGLVELGHAAVGGCKCEVERGEWKVGGGGDAQARNRAEGLGTIQGDGRAAEGARRHVGADVRRIRGLRRERRLLVLPAQGSPRGPAA